jgi:TRAP transporter TAXI family solute receptor
MKKNCNLKAIASMFIAVSLVFSLLFAGCGTSNTQKQATNTASGTVKNLAIATASIGGTYYIVGAGIADMLSKNMPGSKVSAVISQGSVGNPKLVDSGETQLGITNYLSGVQALKGEKPYAKPLKISGIMSLQFSMLHLVTLEKNKDINSISDLKGKKIAMGPAGGGGALLFQSILPFWGLSISDIKPSYIAYADGSDALKDGNVDMNIPHGAPPMDAITSLASSAKIKIIPIEDDKIAEIVAKYPSYEKTTIPAGTYQGVDKDTPALGIRDILVVNSDVDETTVYNITKALYENLEQLKKLHPALKDLTLDGYKDSLVPLHPGAKKFYEEKGIKIY